MGEKHNKMTSMRLEGSNFNVETFFFSKWDGFAQERRCVPSPQVASRLSSGTSVASRLSSAYMLIKLLRILDGSLCISITFSVCGTCTVP